MIDREPPPMPPTCDGPVMYEQISGILLRRSCGRVHWMCSKCTATGMAESPVNGGAVQHTVPR